MKVEVRRRKLFSAKSSTFLLLPLSGLAREYAEADSVAQIKHVTTSPPGSQFELGGSPLREYVPHTPFPLLFLDHFSGDLSDTPSLSHSAGEGREEKDFSPALSPFFVSPSPSTRRCGMYSSLKSPTCWKRHLGDGEHHARAYMHVM